jgi:ribosomal protein S18 acetylase RimI-like enzyme
VRGPGGPRRTFRPLGTHDLGQISRVHYSACLIAYRFMNWSYSLQQVEAWYSPKFAEWTWTLAAFEGDAMAGFIALRGWHIDQLFVDPSYQREGIATALLGEALKYIPGQATLHVFEENRPARAFYERHGFGERDRWIDPEEGAIDLLYVREG